MSVYGVASTQSSESTTGSSSSSSTNTTTLDKDAFLMLLVTELKNQDPMNPMDGKESITQLAQFSALEQMQQLNTSFGTVGKSSSATQAFSMVGSTVAYCDSDGELQTGKVSGVGFEDGWPYLVVGTDSVSLSDVTGVY